MPKKGIQRIESYFGGTRPVILMASGCAIYFILIALKGTYIKDSPFLINVLPPLSYKYYIGQAIFVIIAQTLTWKSFKLFDDLWYKTPLSYLLFISESITTFFVLSLCSWVVYFFTEASSFVPNI